ncbi:acetylornithine transaminase [Heyndrickxia sp. NPDC080065]|uniref:acetylornithine transaminase n=1 Tax=Heyndrickxia sp. NPDC080065 TaxID=3390568 RepID=UPI003D08C3CC
MLNETLVDVSSSLMNTYKRAPFTLVKGKGSFVWDMEGEQYLDFTSGIATCNLGHVPEKVNDAIVNQLQNLWHCSNLFRIDAGEKLAKMLTNNSCFDKVFFCNSGAEANEAAIKLARIYAKNILKKEKTEMITFKQSFHGRTLATLAATGQEKIQDGFAPLMPGFQYLVYNDMAALEQIENINPCAVMLELVQGEGGVIPADYEWIQELASLCKKKNILLIVDEIQTGMGRTGTLFAYEHYGIEPDIMTLAKGLGSGFPIGAMLAKDSVAIAFQPGSHGSTFGGNPLATTAGCATVEQFISTKILPESNQQMNYLWEQLRDLKKKFSIIKEIRGKGFLIGIVIEGESSKIVELALSEKLLILTAGPNVVRILPPLTVTKEEIDQFLFLFNKILKEMELK